MVKKHKNQPSSCPEGWIDAGMSVDVRFTVRQEKYAKRCVGIARSVYNQMVITHQMCRAQIKGLWPSPMELEKEFNSLKHDEDFGMQYAAKVSKFVSQGACRDFRRSYENWLNPNMKSRKPKLHKKNTNGTGSFLAASGVKQIRYDGHRRIKLPYLGWVKMVRELPDGVIIYEVRICKHNGVWSAGVQYFSPPKEPEYKTHVLGAVDVGIRPLAVDSELVHYENPKAMYRYLKKMRRLQRAQSRCVPGSKGWHQKQERINTIYRRIVGIRNNAHHQLSRWLVGKFRVLGIESLNVAGMDKLRNQAMAVRDAAIGGLLWKIKYKAGWYGTIIVEAARNYPSSKRCSNCKVVNHKLGREMYWECVGCGMVHDRNENASLCLLDLVIEWFGELDNFALGPVGPDVTLSNVLALANGNRAIDETEADEERTALLTGDESSRVGNGALFNGARTDTVINYDQLTLAI